MTLMAKIKRLHAHVESLAPPTDRSRLEPGLAPARAVSLLEEHGVAPLPELVELYSWANGGDDIDGAGLMFLSLENAIELRTALADQMSNGWDPHGGWNPALFPIVSENGDVDVFLDISTGALSSFCYEDGEGRQVAAHYDHLLDALLEAFDVGAEFIEDDDVPYRLGIFFAPGVWPEVKQRFNVQEPFW